VAPPAAVGLRWAARSAGLSLPALARLDEALAT
jgi:hypothetical protein